jgi:hypothetical protein
LKDKEAVEAENACQAALAAQHEATVWRLPGGEGGGGAGGGGGDPLGGGGSANRPLALRADRPLLPPPRPQIRATQEKARELAAVHAAAVGALLDKYASLRAEVDAYNAALEAAVRGGSLWGVPEGGGRAGRVAGAGPGLVRPWRGGAAACLVAERRADRAARRPADDGAGAAAGGSSTGSLLAGVKAAVAAAAAAPPRLSVPGPGLAGRASLGFGAADVAKLRDQLTDLTM